MLWIMAIPIQEEYQWVCRWCIFKVKRAWLFTSNPKIISTTGKLNIWSGSQFLMSHLGRQQYYLFPFMYPKPNILFGYLLFNLTESLADNKVTKQTKARIMTFYLLRVTWDKEYEGFRKLQPFQWQQFNILYTWASLIHCNTVPSKFMTNNGRFGGWWSHFAER